MKPYVFSYRREHGIPPSLDIRDLSSFGWRNGWPVYRVITEQRIAEGLCEYNTNRSPQPFRYIEGEALDRLLGSASEAATAIRNGEYDDVLDLLLFAEREVFDERVTVIEAITDRHNSNRVEAGLTTLDPTERLDPRDFELVTNRATITLEDVPDSGGE